MKKISKEELQSLSRTLMFELSDKELEDIQDSFEVISKQMEIVQNIETRDIEPSSFPFLNTNNAVEKLRKDVFNSFSDENKPKFKNDEIIVNDSKKVYDENN